MHVYWLASTSFKARSLTWMNSHQFRWKVVSLRSTKIRPFHLLYIYIYIPQLNSCICDHNHSESWGYIYLPVKRRFYWFLQDSMHAHTYELAVSVLPFGTSILLSSQYTQIESIYMTHDLRQFLRSFICSEKKNPWIRCIDLVLQMPFCSFAAQSLVTIFCRPSVPCFVHTSPKPKRKGKYTLQLCLPVCVCTLCMLTHNRASSTTAAVRYR